MMNSQIYFDLVLIALGLVYVLGCKFHLSRIMPDVGLIFSNAGMVGRYLDKSKIQMICIVIFSISAWLFLMFRAFCAMQYFGIDLVTCCGVIIFAGLFGTYTLFFHSVFNLIVINANVELSRLKQNLEQFK